MRPGGKRIAMFLDGTWNTLSDNTNIWRMRALCAEKNDDGARQVIYYDQGVGTRFGEYFRGGIFGYGLDRNLQAAYRWLIETYTPGDDIFVFGFSRGAFTARSLTGLIARCGLLQPGAPLSLEEVYARYRQGGEVRPIYKLEWERRDLARRVRRGGSALEPPPIYPYTRVEEWLLAYSTRVPIQMIGVFDTVGALGVPFGSSISSSSLFHNTRLSNIYRNAYQALAIDEHRKHFLPTLWTRFTPTPSDPAARQPKRQPAVEQRWFPGAHANIGGGYRDNRLSQLPLAWLVEKAKQNGLAFRYPVQVDSDSHMDNIVDSYSQMAHGAYKLVTLGTGYHRIIGEAPRTVTNPNGTVTTVAETIDASVFDRWRAKKDYRSHSLESWANRRSLDPSQLVGPIDAQNGMKFG
jgi:uncharacterized protein (DUF2235 family)